jgi:probable HAF family extracellular repeat protein
MKDIGTLGGNSSTAQAINDNGQVVGLSINLNGDFHHAFLYDGTTMNDLGTLGGKYSLAAGINDNGQVVGYSYIANGDTHAFLYDGTTMKDIGTLGGNRAYPGGINDNGQVVGYSYNANGVHHAFLYDELDGMLDLNNLIASDSGWFLSEARGVNSSGQIVGKGTINGETHAYLLTPVP